MSELRVAFSLLISITSWCLAPVAPAQDNNAQSDNQTPADFSNAITQLVKLGFPSTKNSKFVNIQSATLNDRTSYYSDDEDDKNSKPPTLTGNSWLLPTANDQKYPTAILPTATTSLFKDTGNANSYSQEQRTIEGKRTPGDITKDLTAINKWLQNHSSTVTKDHRWDYQGKELFTKYFILACQAHQAGHADLANKTLTLLFTISPKPEELLNTTITYLADAELETVTQSFNQSKDWKAYHQNLISLRKKFARGWTTTYALAVLIPKVEKRANNTPTPTPSIKDHTFSSEVSALLAATAKDNQSIKPPNPNHRSYYNGVPQDDGSLWLLSEKKRNTSDSPFNQLASMGMEGFIALTSLLGDDTLIIPSKNSSSSHYSSHYYSSSSSDSPMEIGLRHYQTMDRPKTRGEYALAFITATLPQENQGDDPFSSRRETPNPEEVHANAIDFWKKNRNASKIELTKYFLQNGNAETITKVASKLIEIATPESFDLYEQSVLTSPLPSNFSNTIKDYAIKRREAAAPFLAKYKTALLKELGPDKLEDYDTQGQRTIQRAGTVEKFISKLLPYTEGLKPAQLLIKLSRKDADTTQILEQLSSALKQKPLGPLRGKFAYALAKADNPDKIKILRALSTLQTPAPKTEGFDPSMSKFETEDWLTLLKPEKSDPSTLQQLSGPTATLLESYADPAYDQHSMSALASAIGYNPTYKLYINRAIARLEGKPLSNIPSKNDVTKEQLTAIINNITDATPPEVINIIDNFTPSEKLAFYDHIEEVDPPASYEKTDTLITSIDTTYLTDTTEAEKAIPVLKTLLLAKEPNAQTFQNLLRDLSKNQETLAGLAFGIAKDDENIGYKVHLYKTHLLKTQSKDLQPLDKEITDKKFTHHAAIMIDLDEDEAKLIVNRNGEELSKEDINQIVAMAESMSDDYLNGVFLVENATSLKAAENALKATEKERKVIIQEIKKLDTNNQLEDMNLEILPLQTLEQYKAYLETRE